MKTKRFVATSLDLGAMFNVRLRTASINSDGTVILTATTRDAKTEVYVTADEILRIAQVLTAVTVRD